MFVDWIPSSSYMTKMVICKRQ
nr:unnamed protein product [Callosobruchus chinensis]